MNTYYRNHVQNYILCAEMLVEIRESTGEGRKSVKVNGTVPSGEAEARIVRMDESVVRLGERGIERLV